MTSEEAIRREPVFVWEEKAQQDARLASDPVFLGERMRQAAVRGDVGAQLGWAHMLLEGHGTTQDPEAAFRWFQLAARSGNADAINMVGRCHELGWGTARNTRTAAQGYRTAAEMGHAWASFNLAMLMLAHDGVEGEKGEALALMVQAARRGNAKAMNFIGETREDGHQSPPKIAAARRWYARAARRGCFRGAFNLARHFMAEGDVDRAVRWLERSVAAAPGNFCAELAAYLAEHPDIRVREVAARALERAQSAPMQLAPHVPEFDIPALTSAKVPASALERGRRSMGQALRALTGVKRPRRA